MRARTHTHTHTRTHLYHNPISDMDLYGAAVIGVTDDNRMYQVASVRQSGQRYPTNPGQYRVNES